LEGLSLSPSYAYVKHNEYTIPKQRSAYFLMTTIAALMKGGSLKYFHSTISCLLMLWGNTTYSNTVLTSERKSYE